ncbi:MAG TPA: isoprenylcysteine carboxylmethyltransferase family protein [Anaerolineales bacterium]|nr:isoprenylcysteine carboxylmethyltransferase family protein [Anaerolineales bacterium]
MEWLFRLVAGILLLSALGISVTYRHRANKSGDDISPKEEGRLILALRSIFGLAGWLSALVYLINPYWMAWAQLDLPDWARWTGAAIMAVCLPLIFWVFSSLGNNVTPTVVTRREHSLVVHGPYRWVRHPLYTVGFISFIGFSLLSAMWFTALALVLGFSVLVMRTPLEEKRLIERFGDEYQEYMRRTGRYLPRLIRVGKGVNTVTGLDLNNRRGSD